MKSIYTCLLSLKFRLSLIVVLLALHACVQEEVLPVKVDFEMTVVDNNYAVPAKIKINNQTSGAEYYRWTFEGGDPSTSTVRNPVEIIYSKAGTYKIRLEASNDDGSKDLKEMVIQVGNPVSVNYAVQIIDNNYPPATITIVNRSTGGEQYEWTFEGGTPATSKEKEPKVIFEQSGKHLIRLKVSNGAVSQQKDTVITVAPDILPDFDIQPEYATFEAPLHLSLKNKSIGATQYQWTIQGAGINSSAAENPTVLFTKEGNYTISLAASNGKKTKTIEKTTTIKANSNIFSIKDLKLGINTAHGTIESFYSTTMQKVFKQTDTLSTKEGASIDIVYFGLDKNFTFNTFISPDKVQDFTFEEIPAANATQWVFVQKQLSVSDFDLINNDALLSQLSFTAQNGTDSFKGTVAPAVFIFRTGDGRKGALKIKEFVRNGSNDSYILLDIKVQKKGS